MESQASAHLNYSDFLRLCHDLGLITILPITIVEFGDMYLTTIFFSNFSPSLRRIDYREFTELLVRY
jgi:hypothetical protein